MPETKEETPGNAVAVPTVGLPKIAEMIDAIQATVKDSTDPIVRMRILESMLTAETEEALFASQEAGTVASKDFVERPFRLQAEGIEFFASGPQFVEQGGFPFYALLNVTTIPDGDRVVINAGGLSTMGILRKLLEFEATKPADEKPFAPYADEGGRPLQFVARTTNSGYDVILLKPVITVQSNVKNPTTRKPRESA